MSHARPDLVNVLEGAIHTAETHSGLTFPQGGPSLARPPRPVWTLKPTDDLASMKALRDVVDAHNANQPTVEVFLPDPRTTRGHGGLAALSQRWASDGARKGNVCPSPHPTRPAGVNGETVYMVAGWDIVPMKGKTVIVDRVSRNMVCEGSARDCLNALTFMGQAQAA